MLYIKEVDILKHDLLQNQMCALFVLSVQKINHFGNTYVRYLKVMKDNFKYYIFN